MVPERTQINTIGAGRAFSHGGEPDFAGSEDRGGTAWAYSLTSAGLPLIRVIRGNRARAPLPEFLLVRPVCGL